MNEPKGPDSRAKIKREAHQRALFAWFSALKNAKLYAMDHPSTNENAERLAQALNDVFHYDLELSVEQTDGLFRIGDEIFVEESLSLFDLLHRLEELKISRVLFLPGIDKAETKDFVQFLVASKIPVTEMEKHFSSARIRLFPEQAVHQFPTSRERTHHRIKETLQTVEQWIHRTDQLFTHLLEEQQFSMSDLSSPMEELDDALRRNPSLFSMAFASARAGSWTAQHAVRTMLLAMHLGQELDLDGSTQKTLGLSALLHDIGRSLLPSDFITGSRLSEPDLDFVRLHTRDGATFLAGVHGLPVSVVRVAFEHHVGFDGKGYPDLPAGVHPHVLSQIVGLADFVSWQTVSEREYHKPVPLYRVVRALMRRAGTQFDPVLVKLALPFLGLYPTGTELKLTNGMPAVSLEPNIRNIHRPAVALSSGGKSEYKWLSETGAEGFPLDVAKPTGEASDIAPLFPLIPTLFQTNT